MAPDSTREIVLEIRTSGYYELAPVTVKILRSLSNSPHKLLLIPPHDL